MIQSSGAFLLTLFLVLVLVLFLVLVLVLVLFSLLSFEVVVVAVATRLGSVCEATEETGSFHELWLVFQI